MKRNLTFFQEGGSAATGSDMESDLPRDAEEAIARIAKLGKVFEVRISPYEALSTSYARAAAPRGEGTRRVGRALGAYTTLYDDLAGVLAQPAAYSVPMQVCAEDGCIRRCHRNAVIEIGDADDAVADVLWYSANIRLTEAGGFVCPAPATPLKADNEADEP